MEFGQTKSIASFAEKRTRKQSGYKKISNETRQKLIEMVYLKDFLLKDAAAILDINYSTAKTILRIFRMEKRVEKKNADEDKALKSYISGSIIQNNPTKSAFMLTNNETHSTTSNNARKFTNGDLERYDFTISDNDNLENMPSLEKILAPPKKMSSMSTMMSSYNKEVESFNNSFNKLSSSINSCFGMIKSNQEIINSMMGKTTNMMVSNTNTCDREIMIRMLFELLQSK